jgi:WS/DGAT/MGAT family acyltransferase
MIGRQLSGMDAAFLYAETADAPLHVMGALVLESNGRGPREDFRRIRAQIERRLPGLPILRRKLAEVPLALGRPFWTDDPAFDLDAHLHRTALPAPGGDRELFEAIARIAEVPLRRDRPLWEMWVIEGLVRGRFALVAKIHHSAVDGIGGAQLMCGLMDVDRDALPRRSAEAEPEPEPAPSSATLFADAALSLGVQPLRGAWQILRSSGTGARLALTALSKRESPLPSAPRTRLNGRVTSRRSVALGSVQLSDVKRVKNAYAATVNHVVLAACAGALRRYLGAHGEIPQQPLVAAVPMALGERPSDGLGNSLSALLVRLPVHLADPLERLRAAREASLEAMRTHELLGNQLNEWANLVSPPLFAGAAQLYTRLGLADRVGPVVNLVMSNVPGPDMPLYCAGARVTACHPIGPIYDGCALNLTVMSYDGSLGIGAVGCPDTVPAVDEIPRAFAASVDELVQIVDSASPSIAAAS